MTIAEEMDRPTPDEKICACGDHFVGEGDLCDLCREWDAAYPTPAARAYRDSFLQGAAVGGYRAIPDYLLSRAIDRALRAGTPPLTAGRVLADTYFRIEKRRDFWEPDRRSGVLNPTAYLLKCFEEELKRG